MTEFTQLITTVGFPIACCMALAGYVFKVTDANKKELQALNAKLESIIEKTCECIINNTNALEELKNLVKKEETNGKE